ncbi:kinesin-like protein KIF13A, partial [Leptotrombidium deliense]
MEKLENKLIDMRDLYEEWKEKGGLLAFKDSTTSDPSLKLIDPFYESQENHHLIGVANVFLEVLFHDVLLDYQVPIISQQGEVAGRLHIEIGRLSGFIGERMADASDSCVENDDSCSRNQIVVRIAIKSAKGLPVSLSNYVFCQYSFWGCSDAIVVP